MTTPPPPPPFDAAVAAAARAVEARVIAWRRDIHRHPELGNSEVRTAKLVADHLRAIGLDEVREGVAHTGVVGVLRGDAPGPAVALRADMDALPVTEEVDVPFRSGATAEWHGRTAGVMHACGHDAHTAILMGVAEILAEMRGMIRGSVTFLFQPAEEGAPPGEQGGAKLMVEQGCLRDPDAGAVFGLHVTSRLPTAWLGYRPGPTMASSDEFNIHVRGVQTHAALPWGGVDPIVVGAQIVLGLQTIVSRQMNIAKEPSVLTVGVFQGGVRHNIIPDDARLEGTIRAFDEQQRDDIHVRLSRTAEMIACSAGATAHVHIDRGYDVTVNDPALSAWAAPVLERAPFAGKVLVIDKVCASEDFSAYQKVVPGFFYFLGCTPPGVDPASAAPNHSPRFYLDEDCLKVGVTTLCLLALDWLSDCT